MDYKDIANKQISIINDLVIDMKLIMMEKEDINTKIAIAEVITTLIRKKIKLEDEIINRIEMD